MSTSLQAFVRSVVIQIKFKQPEFKFFLVDNDSHSFTIGF